MLREGQVLFTYLHLAPDAAQTQGLLKAGCVAIAYETVTDERGGLPLLAPMSEVAGRMSIQAGAHALEKEAGGRGVLLGGVPGVPPAKVVVLGGGVVGMNALRMGLGLEADVTVIDRSLPRLKELDLAFAPALKTRYATVDVDRGERPGRGPRDRRGSASRRNGPAPGHSRDGPGDEARLGRGGRLDRPGRLLRDLAADDALESDLRRG